MGNYRAVRGFVLAMTIVPPLLIVVDRASEAAAFSVVIGVITLAGLSGLKPPQQ